MDMIVFEEIHQHLENQFYNGVLVTKVWQQRAATQVLYKNIFQEPRTK